MLSVFDNPSQSGLWIVWWKVSQEGICMYHLDFFFFFFMQINMETNKQTENLLMLNAIIPKACKKWWEEPSFQKNVFYDQLSFIINIERFAGINVVNGLTEAYFFTSSFILQVVNISVLLFWNLCVLDKLWHCFLNVKGHLKLIKFIIIIAADINVITNGIFIIISILYIMAELTELHELALIASFLFLSIVKVYTRKLK